MSCTRTIHQTQEMIDRYGHLNGDNDIIHYDRDYALARGFRDTLNHGMMTLGYIADMGAERFGRDWFYAGTLEVKWIDAVCPGEDLVVTDEDGHITCRVDDSVVATGSIGRAES